MYICLCKAITQNKLEQIYAKNKGNAKATLKELGVGSDCGTCLSRALKEIGPTHQNSTDSKQVKPKAS